MDIGSLCALVHGQFKASVYRSWNLFTFWAKLVLTTALLIGIFVSTLHFDWKIESADGLIAGIAIFAGGFLTAFTHLSTVRQTLQERESIYGEAEAPERELIDVSVTNLLSATLVSVVTAAVLIVGRNAAADGEGRVTGIFAATTWTGSALAFFLFISAVPTLYSAYLQMNNVRPEVDGSDYTKSK